MFTYKGPYCSWWTFTVLLPQDVKLHQHIDDILVRGSFPGKVGEAAASAWRELHKAEVAIPPDKYQEPRREVKFLSTWCIVGTAVFPLDTLRKIEQLQIPQSKKEL